ncbi:MAG: DEAD/DEAH box helicase [Planctomycetia bacterium]
MTSNPDAGSPAPHPDEGAPRRRRRGSRGGRGRRRGGDGPSHDDRSFPGAPDASPGLPARGGWPPEGGGSLGAEEDHDAPPLDEPVSGAEAAAARRRSHAGEDEEPEAAVETRFAEFPLPKRLVRGIAAAGYIEPTEVQRRLIPLALSGKNVVARSRTGTGKTAAFVIPVLARLPECADDATDTHPHGPVRVLAVVPTRELALQMAAEAAKLARFLPVDEACIYGGTRFPAQVDALRTAAIVVGTPGRLLDHLGRGTLKLDRIETVVLDEVDRMYDLGFRDDVDKLLRYASARKQTLLLSATFNEDVQRLVAKHLPEHERFEVQSASLTVDEVQQTFYVVDRERKLDLLMAVAAQRNPTRCIVFVRTKFSADRVAYRLQQQGFNAQEIHSGLVQKRREQILQGFRDGSFPIMVATDVASRGLDIQGVDHVINLDIPENPEDYVHRVGRTARMGKQGWAITFVTPDDGAFLTTIEKLINKEIKQEAFPGFEVARRRPLNVATPDAPGGAPAASDAPPPPPKPPSAGIPQWNRPARRRR